MPTQRDQSQKPGEAEQRLSIIILAGFALTAISGVFYPISGYPEWVQWIAQVFPVYWLVLGLRSALLRRMARRESGSRVQASLTRDNSWSTS
jgi:hypothetical protein